MSETLKYEKNIGVSLAMLASRDILLTKAAENVQEDIDKIKSTLCSTIAAQERVIADLKADKERLDWLDYNKVAMNRLSQRDEIIDYWHLYWTPPKQSHCNHFGHQDFALGSLRQIIDAAIAQTKSKGDECHECGGLGYFPNNITEINSRCEACKGIGKQSKAKEGGK